MDGPQIDDSGEDTQAQDSPQEEESPLSTEDITSEMFEEVCSKTQTVISLIDSSYSVK